MTYPMHQLNTGNKFVSDIFSEKSFYNIPLYQRPYVWEKEQITVLLDDVLGAMQRDDQKEYFLGCMVWNTREKVDPRSGMEYTSQDILDGQQRFITLYLLLGVIRDLSEEPEHRKDINKDLYQRAIKHKGIPERSRVVFEVREDADFLATHLMEEGGTLQEHELVQLKEQEGQSLSVRNLSVALLVMHDWWAQRRAELEASDLFQTLLEDFHTYLSTKVMLLYLATPDSLDDAYNLFTVLNSRGVQLRVSDILRAQNLRVIEDPTTQKVYAKKWARFENVVGAPFRNFDEFLWMFIDLMMKYRSAANRTILNAFRFMEKKGMIEFGTPLIDLLERYVDHYVALTDGSLNRAPYGLAFSNLNAMLIETFGGQHFAVLVQYLERFGTYRALDVLVKVDNLLTAAWLIGRKLPLTRIHIIVKRIDALYTSAQQEGQPLTTAADAFIDDRVLEYSYVHPKSSAQAIDLDTVFKTYEEEDFGAYSGTKSWKTHYLLYKLDLLYGNIHQPLMDRRQPLATEYLMPKKMSVENHWEVEPAQHEQWVYKLGNIALANTSKSYFLSQKPYKEKKAAYERQGLDSRPHLQQLLARHEVWTLGTLQDNHRRVVELLQYYYLENDVRLLHPEQRHWVQRRPTVSE